MPKTVLNIHPKVFTSLLTGLGIVVLAALGDHIEPSLFTRLGVWSTPAALAASTAIASLAGWLKSVKSTEDAADPADAVPLATAQSIADSVSESVGPVLSEAFAPATDEPKQSDLIPTTVPANLQP